MAEKTSSQPIRQVVLRVNVRVTPPHTTTSAQAHVQTREKIAPANKRFTVTCLDTDSFARASIERRQITQISKREVDCQQHTCTHIQTQKQAATHNTDTHTETVMVMHAIALVSGIVGASTTTTTMTTIMTKRVFEKILKKRIASRRALRFKNCQNRS